MIVRSALRTQSVVIPCRGHSRFLRETLESMRSQWKTLDQVILVCDDDKESERVALRFIEEQPKGLTRYSVIQLDAHSGVYSALNVGLGFNECDVVSFCGSDDLWEPTRSRDIMRCFHGWKVIGNTYHQKISESGARLKRSVEPLGGAFSYSRRMLEKLGHFRQWECSADSDMFYRSQALGGQKTIYRAYTYLYRQHGNQLTHRRDTGFGSETRDMYQSMWHDGTKFHEADIVGYKEVHR